MEMAFCVVKCLSVRLGKQRVIVSKKKIVMAISFLEKMVINKFRETSY